MAKKIASILQYSIFMGLGIFLVWWSLKELTSHDWQEISDALKKGNLWLTIPGFIILLLSHWVRALRWRLLIEPLGYKPSKVNIFFSVMIGYLGNQAVPRLGEVLRCSTLTKYEKIPFDKLLGTVIVERIIDALTLLIVFVLALLLQPSLYQHIIDTFFANQSTGTTNNTLYYVSIVLACIIIVSIVFVYTSKKVGVIIKNIKRFFQRVWEGILTIKSLKKRWTFIILTITIWSLYIACIYIGFFMLSETKELGFTEAITVLCAGSVGIIATPGGIGAYAILVQKTLYLYHINSSMGLTIGWLQWLLQVSVTLIAGISSLIALPVYNKKKL